MTIMEDFFRRARAHRLHALSDRRTREDARHLAENGDAVGASDLLDIAELALHPALAAGGGGEPFNGGTITEPFIIDTDDAADTPLLVQAAEDQSGDVLVVKTDDGTVMFRVPSQGGILVYTPTTSGEGLTVSVIEGNSNGLANFAIGGSHMVDIGGDSAMGFATMFVHQYDHSVPALAVGGYGYDDSGVFTVWTPNLDTGKIGFFGHAAAARPEVPATPTAQDVVDALVALGLISQAS